MRVNMLRGFTVGMGALCGLALLAPSTAQAQAQRSGTRFGIAASYGDNDVGFGVGAFVKFHLAELNNRPVTGRASFDYFFPSYDCGIADCGVSFHYWEISADALYDIANESSNLKPYVGAGVGLAHTSFSYDNDTYCGIYDCGAGSSDFGLNILGGINFMGNSKLMPFVEAKYELRSGGEFIIKGGIHF